MNNIRTRCLSIALFCAALAIGSNAANAEEVQIGTLNVMSSSTPCAYGTFYCFGASIDNLMSDAALDIQGFTQNGTSITAAQTIGAGQTHGALSGDGPTSEYFTIYGSLSSNDFTIGGQEYQESPLNQTWVTPQFFVTSNGWFAIDILANPITPTPEPASSVVLAIALLGLVMASRRLSWRAMGVRDRRDA